MFKIFRKLDFGPSEFLRIHRDDNLQYVIKLAEAIKSAPPTLSKLGLNSELTKDFAFILRLNYSKNMRYEDYTVVELRGILRKLGAMVSGNKKELIKRLYMWDEVGSLDLRDAKTSKNYETVTYNSSENSKKTRNPFCYATFGFHRSSQKIISFQASRENY
jgi:hypothetical protein